MAFRALWGMILIDPPAIKCVLIGGRYLDRGAFMALRPVPGTFKHRKSPMNLVGNKATIKSSGVRKLLLNSSAVLILLFLTALFLMAAELISRLIIGNAAPSQKIFPEFSRAIYKTSEFDCVANINRYGFRGTENRLLPGQVAVIGDSFVFGWGVSDDETWPAKLQDHLSKTGAPLKVYNLGRPGADPEDYLDIARAHVPVLRPKVVLVSLLQADDLEQLLERRRRKMNSHDDALVTRSTGATVEKNFPGLISLARSIQHPTAMATATWEADVKFRMQHSAFFKVFNERVAMMPPDIRTLTETGNINPAMIADAAEVPEKFIAPYEEPDASWLDERITKILEEIKRLVEMNGGALILLSMPHPIYFPSETRENGGLMGFQLPPLGTDKPDEFADRLASKSHVKSILLAQKLRPRNDLSKIWFRLDGHPTQYGNEVLEKYIFEAMLSAMGQGHGQ